MAVKRVFATIGAPVLLAMWTLAIGQAEGPSSTVGEANAYPRRVTFEQARQDAEQLFSTLDALHPNLYARIAAAEFGALQRRTLAEIASRRDGEGRVSLQDLDSILQFAAAALRDGHTQVGRYPGIEPLDQWGAQFPPFWLDARDGHFFIRQATDQALAGSELVAVNGTPAAEFFRPILDRCSGETLTWKATRLVAEQPFWLASSRVFGTAPAAYKLSVRDADGGGVRERVVKTVDAWEYSALFSYEPAFQPDFGRSPVEPGTRVEFPGGGQVARLVYPECASGQAAAEALGNIFRQLDGAHTQDLILDLRGNSGGSTPAVESLFRHLYAGKYRGMSQIGSRRQEGAPTPQVQVVKIPERAHPKPAAFYSGRVYLLVDNGTFSSAVYFAAMFRDYRAGTIVGYETGGVPVGAFSAQPFTLRNSRIECSVSTRQMWPSNPQAGDDRHGVLPDVPLSPKLLAPYRDEADPALAFTLEYIRSARQGERSAAKLWKQLLTPGTGKQARRSEPAQ